MASKGLDCVCSCKRPAKSSQRRPYSSVIVTEDLSTSCRNWEESRKRASCFSGFFEAYCFGLNSSRQTMYDFVDGWMPGQKGNRSAPWSSKARVFNDSLRLLNQSKENYVNLDLDEDNCQCTSHGKTARRRRLRSKSGFYLTIMPNGQVLGVKDPTNVYVSLDVIPVGADVVKIWGVEAELFLMIDDAGLLRATDVDGPECIFEEAMTEDFCTVYYSTMYSHKQWCVGLKTRPLSTFSGAFRRNKLSLRDCSFLSEIVNRRSSTSSSQSTGSDGRISSL